MVVVTAISSFMLIEDDKLLGFDRSAPRVMVDMDLSNGLPDELEVQWEGGTFVQRLDYWKVAFRCHYCQ